jgi:hypothetical protein
MRLAQGDHVVGALASDRSDQPFGTTTHLPPQHDQLMSEHHVLCLKSRRHGGQSWTSSHRQHEETGEFRSIQVFDFVKHAPDHGTVLKRYETSLDAMATTRRPYTR